MLFKITGFMLGIFLEKELDFDLQHGNMLRDDTMELLLLLL
jgi:hypothetical protein